MNFKRLIALIVSVTMVFSLMPAAIFTAHAASTHQIIDAYGGDILWSAPDGMFYKTDVDVAWDGWLKSIVSGYVNVETTSVGNTLQYYAAGTNNVASVISPGYGSGDEKIIIEWNMAYSSPVPNDLYFDFSFVDVMDIEIASLKLDKNAVDVGYSHPNDKNSFYAMGFPALGTPCAIVAYNNSDGATHTAEYYVNGECVTTQSELPGIFNNFKAIISSNGRWSTTNAFIGFANLTIGSVANNAAAPISVTATYTADGEPIGTQTLICTEDSAGAAFPKKNFFHNGEVWYAEAVTLKEDSTVELKKYDRFATKAIGDTFELNGTAYKVTGGSAVVNGNFVSGDTTGWTNRVGTAITDGSVSYTTDINGNMLMMGSTGGKDATNSIGTSWAVTAGQKYYLSFYAGGDKPDNWNYTYNQIFQSDKSTPVFGFGEEMVENGLVRFEKIITPTGDSLYFQCSWTGTVYLGNFELLPVVEYAGGDEEDTTEEPTEESTEEPTEDPYEEPTQYGVIEDAFVQSNRLYGINTTNTDGVMVASSADANRGPQYDANGETTYLYGATPTTLGSTRVGLMQFPVADIEENERATLKFYVRSWHSQGFDGGNTFLRIAVTPLADSSWTNVREGRTYNVGNAGILSAWSTPVFSEKATNKVDYVSVDVTEIMHAAHDAGLEYVSLKLQIYWGAAYIVEREAAISGTYAGKAAYIEVAQDKNLKKLTVSGAATLTKNGSVMNGYAYVTDNDDVRLQLDGAEVIGADSGYYFPNEKLTFTENTNITNTMPLGFGLTMVEGAQVRYGEGIDKNGNVGSGNGLRFITMVDRMDTLAGLDGAELGVIISAEDSDATTKIEAEKWQDDEHAVFTTALTNLAVSNYNRKFTATPYVTVGDKTFTGDSITRSIYYVASGLLVNDSTDNTEYDEVSQVLYDVLNAYVNQVGIRLTFSDNADFSDWALSARVDGVGSYTGDAFFEVGETEVDGKVYSVKLTPLGDKTVIKTDDNYWNNYVRINNNNGQIKLYTTLTDNNDGTYTLSFDTSWLNLGSYPEEKFNSMKPTYESAVAAMEAVNTYWQTTQSYIDWYGNTHPAFWDKAAYHTGNIEMYKLTGDESYLQYSIDWANYNEWMGNNSTSAPYTWTWTYNQTQGSSAVLFGDWQICFQTYLDLYEMGVEGASVDRVYDVIDYQISKEEDNFWWWADALYMVMPVFTKLYKHTGDEKYLDALYKYFRYAKELMYDGPGGIPTSADGYTTSASLNRGASYSDPDDYKYLFFRDASYVYPLLPNPGHEDVKNFWARGDGWVFAGLAKVLSDMPESYEHYDEFYTTYVEMAQAIIACQQVDESGYGFWTQSMLQDYPKGTNGNDEGYETSGTAFFTYGLFWGINNGILTDEAYTRTAIRAWGYLENVALHDSGKVGYVQPIGSNATQAVSYDTTANFGVGAYLLAAAEAARWAENQ